jgi:hypothetical protein
MVTVLYGSSDGVTGDGSQAFDEIASGLGENKAGDSFGQTTACGDFDGDGYVDLAVGAPGGTGSEVVFLHGSAGGLESWNGLLVEDGAYEDFGAALAVGDFQSDGYDDIAIGAPLDDYPVDSGSVSIAFGSATGPQQAAMQRWTQDSPGVPGTAEAHDVFGSSVGVGDFDGDGHPDLAIGIPSEDLSGPINDGGQVLILYGTPDGVTADRHKTWTQDTDGIGDTAEAGDIFGTMLAAGDITGDGFADLVIGVPLENVDSHRNAGGAQLIKGSAEGLTADGSAFFTQKHKSVLDDPEREDQFGISLRIADFDGDGFGDVAVGVWLEDLGADDQGAVAVLYGDSSGLDWPRNDLWSQDSPSIKNSGDTHDLFGMALATANFGHGFRADLAIGVPEEEIGGEPRAGAVNVIFGTKSGLSDSNNTFWNQNSPGVPDSAEGGDTFGEGLQSRRFECALYSSCF